MKIKIPKRVRTGLSFGSGSATSTYRGLERVLTSSTPHDGWRSFILENLFIPICFISGLLLCLSACAYTRNLSTHLLVCPDWAWDCQIRPYITWNANNLALVQGIVTVIYSVGLTLMIWAVRSTTESAIWPILTRHPLSFDQIETYLSIARGQPFSATPAIRMMRRNHAATFLLLTLFIGVMSLAVAPLIGFVFTISDVSRQFKSMYQVGGGVGQTFVQTTPPTSMDIDALVEYQSWSKGFTKEPMPGYRDWILDRNLLENFDSIEASAIRVIVDIECREHDVGDYEILSSDRVRFATNLGRSNSRGSQSDSSDNVEVSIPQSSSALVVWVDDFEFVSSNKSSASLIFVEFNGTIENGIQSRLSRKPLTRSMLISTIACNVEVALQDAIFRVGYQTHEQEESTVPELSSTKYLTPFSQNNTNTSTAASLNEFALWLAVAPVLVGPSIGGLQPLFSKSSDDLPVTRFTADPPSTLDSSTWTLTQLKSFIHTSIGAISLSSSRRTTPTTPQIPTILTVTALTRKMNRERVVYLLIPVAFVVAVGVILVALSVHLHWQHCVPVMRLAGVKEFLESSQSKYLVERLVGEGMGIGGARVMFGLTRGVKLRGVGEDEGGGGRGDRVGDELIAGLSNEVEPFEGGDGVLMRRVREV